MRRTFLIALLGRNASKTEEAALQKQSLGELFLRGGEADLAPPSPTLLLTKQALNNGVVEGGVLYEKGNLPDRSHSPGHGDDRATRRSAGSERAASARQVAASAAIHAISGRTAGTAARRIQPAASARQGAGIHAISGRTAGTAASARQGAASAGKVAASAAIHAISGRTADTAASLGPPAASEGRGAASTAAISEIEGGCAGRNEGRDIDEDRTNHTEDPEERWRASRIGLPARSGAPLGLGRS